MKKLFLSFVMLLATAVSALASIPTTIVELSVDDNGATTFICPFDAELPTDVRAYTVTGWSDETGLILEETSILANQPCILRSESSITETLEGVSQAEEATYTEGALTGVYASYDITAGWVLAEIDGKWGLHEAHADKKITVPANQGYFVFPEDEGPSEDFGGYIPDPFNPVLPEHAHLVLSNNVGTFICPFAVEIPNGMAAFKIMGIDEEENDFVMVPEESGSFQPNTAYMIAGEGNYDIDIPGVKTEHEASYTTGLLTGYYENTQITSGYMVQMGDDELVYVQATQENPLTVPANQCVFSQVPLQPHAISYVTVGEGGTVSGPNEGTAGSSMGAVGFVNDGYQVVSVTVNDGNVPVELQSYTGGYAATYTMPDEDVTVKVTFAIDAEPAKWTDSEGNEVTELMGAKPYYSYLNVFPTITLHLEGAVDQADGEYGFDLTNGIIAEGTTYTVANGQVNQDVTFTLKPVNEDLFKYSALPMIEYRYNQTLLRGDEESAFMPLWDETEWNWNNDDFLYYDMKLDNTTTPAAGAEYVLAKLGEMPVDEDGGFNARALKVNAKKPCAEGDHVHYMEASKITFENRSAGKMTIEFSAAGSLEVPMYINVDGHKYTSVEESPRGNIENLKTTEGYDTQNGSMNESDKKTITFYVNPGVHTVAGRYSGNQYLVYLDYDGELDPDLWDVAYFFPNEAAYGDLEQAILYMDLSDYYADQEIRIYSMHFEPIKYETSINGQYGWASIYHEHDLIVPEMEKETETKADVTFYYASSCDGNNVEIKKPDLQPQADYDGQVIAAETGLVFSGAAGTYVFYGATVGELEEGEWLAGPKNKQPKYDPLAENNLFQGVIEDTPCDPMRYYVMGSETTPELAIFQKYRGTTLGAHKVYLDLNGAAASVRLVLPGNYNPIVTGVEQNAADLKPSKFLMDGKVIITRGARMYNVQGTILR